MNISKNTEKRLPKISSNPFEKLPPIDSMDIWGGAVPDFIEKRTWKVKGIFGICLVAFVILHAFKGKYLWPLKQQMDFQKHLSQKVERESVQLNLNTDVLTTEIANYSANSQQAYLKIVPESVSALMEKSDEEGTEVQEAAGVTAQQIRAWLHQQHIQGVAYKDFESCIVVNGKIFHLNEVVAPELNLVWSDIDPVAKKLFFYDANGILYFINY